MPPSAIESSIFGSRQQRGGGIQRSFRVLQNADGAISDSPAISRAKPCYFDCAMRDSTGLIFWSQTMSEGSSAAYIQNHIVSFDMRRPPRSSNVRVVKCAQP